MRTINAQTVVHKVSETFETVKESSVKMNEFALKSTENVLSNAFVTADKWQVVTGKAVKNGLKFTATQQDMFFDALETAKGQVVKGFNRTKGLFSKN